MFATSAGYHRLTRSESAYRWTRPADHAAIFAAIAGTATPLVASVTSGHTRAVTLSALWGTAGVAAAQRVREVRSGGSGGGWTYVALGWMGAALVPALARRHGLAPAALLAAGGAAYTTGAVLFSQRKGELAPGVFGFHELWHTLTLVGAGLHLGAIALATRDSLPIPSAVTHPTGTMTNVRSLTRQNNQPNHQ
jgi:hemolysin III